MRGKLVHGWEGENVLNVKHNPFTARIITDEGNRDRVDTIKEQILVCAAGDAVQVLAHYGKKTLLD
jgi:hypothetical protein